MLEGRYMPGCDGDFASYAHGAKGTALISKNGHFPAHCRTFKGQNFDPNQTIWKIGHNEPDLYKVEWNDLTEAIRQDRPYSELKRGVQASLVTAMGRMSCHTGQLVTYRRHARVQARVRTRPRQAGVDRFARTGATRSRRQIPCPHAGHHEASRILMPVD